MCLGCHCPCLWFSIFVSQHLIFSWDFPSDPMILSSTSISFFLSPRVHPCLHASLPSYWVYHAKAPSQCVSNYMFLLEAPVSCVASPFVSVARLGPDQRPRSRTPAPPTVQEYHYHPSLGLWQTAVTLGMTRTRLSDPCVWPTLPWQQVAFPSTSLDQYNVECVCPENSAIQRNFNTIGQGVFGYSGSPFQQ